MTLHRSINRSVTDGGWTTRMNDRCEVEWLPPPDLDTGQARINTYHRPERLLRPDDPEPLGDNTDEPAEPGGPAPPEDHAA